jgi:hypothetical protein
MSERFSSLRALMTPGADDLAPPERVQGRMEAVGQGLYGLGDELGAGLQAALASATPGMDAKETYQQALGENRDILRREHAAEPIKSRMLEIGASVPVMAALPGAKAARLAAQDVGFASQAAQALPLGSGVLSAAKAAAPAGGLWGLGKSEASDLPHLAMDTIMGAGTGALGAAGLRLGTNAATAIPAVRNVFGNLARQAMMRRINPPAPGTIEEPRDWSPAEITAFLRAGAKTTPKPSNLAATVGPPGQIPDTVPFSLNSSLLERLLKND